MTTNAYAEGHFKWKLMPSFESTTLHHCFANRRVAAAIYTLLREGVVVAGGAAVNCYSLRAYLPFSNVNLYVLNGNEALFFRAAGLLNDAMSDLVGLNIRRPSPHYAWLIFTHGTGGYPISLVMHKAPDALVLLSLFDFDCMQCAIACTSPNAMLPPRSYPERARYYTDWLPMDLRNMLAAFDQFHYLYTNWFEHCISDGFRISLMNTVIDGDQTRMAMRIDQMLAKGFTFKARFARTETRFDLSNLVGVYWPKRPAAACVVSLNQLNRLNSSTLSTAGSTYHATLPDALLAGQTLAMHNFHDGRSAGTETDEGHMHKIVATRYAYFVAPESRSVQSNLLPLYAKLRLELR